MAQLISRRMRCAQQGCREKAKYGLGKKGNDYPMCEKHFRQEIEEGLALLGMVGTLIPEEEEKPATEQPRPESDNQNEEDIKEDAPEDIKEDAPEDIKEDAPEDIKEDAPEEKAKKPKARRKKSDYNVCPYCNEKFPKDEGPIAYMNHVKKCKKEHKK